MAEAATFDSRAAPGGALKRAWSSDARRRFTNNRLGVISLVWLVFIALASLLGPLVAQEPNHVNVLARLQPPSAEHLFGTDQLGRDILARVLAGGRVSLLTAVVSTAGALLMGMLLGMLTGWRGGMLDELLSRIFDVLTTFPTLLLGILIVVALGPSLTSVMIAIAISYVPLYGRLFRAGTMTVKHHEFVEGVVSLGIPPVRIVLRHILPNVIVPILVISTGAMGRVALAEASLSFLGAGIQPPTASWGNMMADGQPFLQFYPWFPVIPGTILTSVTIAFSFVGDALRDAFDIREAASKAETPA